MVAVVSGTVLEVFKGKAKDGAEIWVARLFQRGEKRNIDVKNVPADTAEGEMVNFKCKLFPWANEKGLADIACSWVQ